MKAALLNGFGGPGDVTVVGNAPSPRIGNDDVLVDIWGGGLNPADLKTTTGMMRNLPLPYVMGHDFIGRVSGMGYGVGGLDIGDIVVGNLGFAGGSFAQQASVPKTALAKLPDGVDPRDAAILPVIGLTALQAVELIGRVGSGDQVLIHGASGSVGSLAAQLAKRAGAIVLGTGSGEALVRMREDGVDLPIDYREREFDDVIERDSLDFVLDTVGGDTLERSVPLLKPTGTIVSIVSSKVETLASRAGVHGRFLVIETTSEGIAEALDRLESGAFRMRRGKSFALENVVEALRALDSGEGGKIMIVVDPGSPLAS